MEVSLDEIYLPAEERIRKETYGDLREFALNLAKFGQLQDILIRPPTDGEVIPDGKRWIIIDGGRRFLAISFANRQDVEIPGLSSGHIGAKIRGQEDELFALEMEYWANEQRADFNWRERALFVRRIHEGRTKQAEEKEEEWNVELTAIVMRVGPQTIYKYLQLTEDLEIFNSDRVQNASTFIAAHKQFQIEKELKNRTMVVEHRAKRVQKAVEAREDGEEHGEVVEVEPRLTLPSEFAQVICQKGDCREWITQVPDETFEWIHWDPYYGGEQAGGATHSFTSITDDTWPYARALMNDMRGELHRVLKKGHWMALWYHPIYYSEVRYMFAGHERDHETDSCFNCGRDWEPHKLLDFCPGAEHPFWVNPYPNIWYKADRVSAGQEIRRFLVNAHEEFLWLAAVEPGDKNPNPILPMTMRQNVFTVASIPRSARRHPMHKPPELLGKMLEVFSLPGEFGCDPSYGSGSIFEAALPMRRPMVGCELLREYQIAAQDTVEEMIKNGDASPYEVSFA